MIKFTIIIFLLFSNIVYSADNEKIETINKIEAYLNNIKTLVANFTQIAPDGSEADGKFFLSRPGKIRWQYNPPNPTLIIFNNSLLTHYDYDLDQVSYASSEDNLSSILTKENIVFGKDIVATNIDDRNNIINITVNNPNKIDDGEINLIFNKNPIEIRKIELTNSTGQLTSIFLNDMIFDQILDKELFIVKNPKYFKNKRL